MISRWIFCTDISAQYPTRKTKTYVVRMHTTGENLGKIEWFAPWNQYCFFPNPSTVWHKDSLHEVTQFTEALMAERKHNGKD